MCGAAFIGIILHERNVMHYGQSWLSAVVITLLSLFSQWLNWFAFEKLEYGTSAALLTPLVLCFMYHLVQLDAGGENCFSRRFFFVFSAAVPFLICFVFSAVMLSVKPELSTFSPEADYAGTAPEVLTVYAGRFMITSLYLSAFALIDIPILKYIDRKRKK